MRSIATANGTMRVDTGSYAATLVAITAAGYMQATPAADGWGQVYVYTPSNANQNYLITSWGSDSAAGPAPPAPWINDPYDPDITLTDGMFTAAPTGQ